MKSFRWGALLLSAGLTTALAGNRIDEILEATATARNAHWGIVIADAESGELVFQRNALKLFVPASNTKLFSTALALMRLGPDYRFTTTVLAERAPDGTGRVRGSLTLVGGGDPNLSGRVLPYQKSARAGDPLTAIKQLADQVIAAGVRRIEGDIVGDDTAYVWAPHPDGWAMDDALWEYGAPVSALTLNDNAINLTISPGAQPGEPAGLTVSPALPFYEIDNRTTTTSGSERKFQIDRDPGSRQLRLWGEIPVKSVPRAMLLGVDDPARFAALALRDELMARGVSITGRAVARHRYPNEVADLEQADPNPVPSGVPLARLLSAPLLEDLRVTNKVSQNLHAELALRAVAKVQRGIGSREAGIAELQEFLAEVGVEEAEFDITDGSGLSRLNLVAPFAIVKLLRFVYSSPQRDNWLSVLPVGGEDGTLSARFVGSAAAGRVYAKTGTLSHVSALSGYARKASGKMLVFAILVNNYRGSSLEIRATIDQICNLLVE